MKGYQINVLRYTFKMFSLFLANEAEICISVDFNLKLGKKKKRNTKIKGWMDGTRST